MRAGNLAATPLQRNAPINNLNSSTMHRARCSPCGNRALVAIPPKLSPHFSRPHRRAKLVIANVAEFTRAAPAEVILCAKIAAHSASLASITVVEDSGE
jgi:rRNA maturation protein Nop10